MIYIIYIYTCLAYISNIIIYIIIYIYVYIYIRIAIAQEKPTGQQKSSPGVLQLTGKADQFTTNQMLPILQPDIVLVFFGGGFHLKKTMVVRSPFPLR